MNRFFTLLAGPEAYWTLLFFACRWLAARNVPPTAAGNASLNWAVWLGATVAVVLSFALLLVPGVNRWMVMVRLGLAGFIGLNACAIVACEAIKYPEVGRDSGLLALWVLAVCAGAAVWTICAVVAAFLIRSTGKVVPVAASAL